jgi:hypothetical protein
MPKPGYACITLKAGVVQLLRKRAREYGMGLNRLILQLLREEDCPGTVPSMKKNSLNLGFFLRKGVDRAGFEPATTRVRAGYSYRAELPAHKIQLTKRLIKTYP